MCSLHHNSGNRRFDAIKDASYQRQFAKGDVEPLQRDQDKQRWKNEQRARHDAALCFMQQPADVNR